MKIILWHFILSLLIFAVYLFWLRITPYNRVNLYSLRSLRFAANIRRLFFRHSYMNSKSRWPLPWSHELLSRLRAWALVINYKYHAAGVWYTQNHFHLDSSGYRIPNFIIITANWMYSFGAMNTWSRQMRFLHSIFSMAADVKFMWVVAVLIPPCVIACHLMPNRATHELFNGIHSILRQKYVRDDRFPRISNHFRAQLFANKHLVCGPSFPFALSNVAEWRVIYLRIVSFPFMTDMNALYV